ncbi:MAG: helix-turn-helix domain-containing protein [Sporolactobacillus sp.]
MAYQLGEVIRQIRHSKKYTQKYISGNEMSRTTYAKIEAGRMQPTVGKFMHILEMLDMSYDEFRFIQNMYVLSGKEEIIHDFFQISTNVECSSLTNLKSKCQKYLSIYGDNIVEDILSVACALILIQTENNYEKAYPYAEKIWERLSKLDNWYSTELKLINNIFFFFPLDTGISIVKRALRETEHFAYIKGNKSLRPAYLINLTLLLLNNKQFDEAEIYANQAIDECTSEKRYDLISIAYARKGIALVNSGKKKQGMLALKKSLEICNALDQEQIAQAIRKEAMEKTGTLMV